MKEMFSKLLKVVKFLFGFCSKLFGKTNVESQQQNVHITIYLGGQEMKKLVYINQKEFVEELKTVEDVRAVTIQDNNTLQPVFVCSERDKILESISQYLNSLPESQVGALVKAGDRWDVVTINVKAETPQISENKKEER